MFTFIAILSHFSNVNWEIMLFEKPVTTHRAAFCLHTHCSYYCLWYLQKSHSDSGLRDVAEADNKNKERQACPSGWSQVRVTTAGLCTVRGSKGITGRKVCSCHSSTRCLPAAGLRRSGKVVLIGLAPKRGSPAPDASWGTFSSSHSCWQMGLHRVIQLSWPAAGGSRSAGWCVSSGCGKSCRGRCPAEGLRDMGRNMRMQQFLTSGIELVWHWN